MIQLWRISRYADLAGTGGLRYPARWHNAGAPIVYLAHDQGSALAETLVHLEIPDRRSLPRDYLWLDVKVDADQKTIPRIERDTLPDDWRHRDHLTRRIGDRWLKAGTSLLLEVPSALLPHSFNVLLNPLHPDIKRVHKPAVFPVEFDPRLAIR